MILDINTILFVLGINITSNDVNLHYKFHSRIENQEFRKIH